MKYWYLLLSLFLFNTSYSQEIINGFESTIVVDTSSALLITETIEVVANNQAIKRGIFRALPTSRRDAEGKSYPISYTLLSVKQNGRKAQFHTTEEGGRFKIYVGSRDIILKPGVYTYEIQYKTYGQIGFFEDFNEIYWNVNGTQWDLAAKQVSARIVLPEGTKPIELNCYTGIRGSTAKNCDAFIDPHIGFTAKNLKPKENLSISVSFEKGTIKEPAPPTWLEKNRFWLMALLTFLGLSGYYYYTWHKHGRDPIKPAVYPIYDPPEDLSPAGVASIKSDRLRTDVFTASLIDLAVKGYIKIEEEANEKLLGLVKSSTYTITKLKSADPSIKLPKEERALLDGFFEKSNKVELNGSYQSNIRTAIVRYEHDLANEYEDVIETGRNTTFLIIPVLSVLVFFFLSFWLGELFIPKELLSFISGGFVFFVFSLMFIFPLFSAIIKKINKTGIYITAGLMIIGLISIVFYMPELDFNIYVLLGFAVFAIISLLAYKYLIEQPTEEKLALQSKVEGFEMYMSAAENNQIQHFNPPEMTPDRFERLLPYAIALGVEKIWGERFKNYLDRSGQAASYHSPWYHGRHRYAPHIYTDISRSVQGGIAQSSTPPSQSGGGGWSSGSGGGGFSGGGGGGGGGGGW